MPWKESNTMDQRVQLIQDHQDGHSISELADFYEVSRKTVYKWLSVMRRKAWRYLADRSRTPLHCRIK